MLSSEPAGPFEQVFRSDSTHRDNFLARLFGIFSEEVVRAWCACPQAPYSNLGRPTLREPGEARGHTLDFTLRHRQSGRTYAAELKCWITWENYGYIQLTQAAQLERLTEPAFVKFLTLARDPSAYRVFVAGRPVDVDGAVLVWGAATPQGRSAAVARGVAEVLTVEDMVSDLNAWQSAEWQNFIAQRRGWAAELFGYLARK
jgi:hypothetical protein